MLVGVMGIDWMLEAFVGIQGSAMPYGRIGFCCQHMWVLIG